MKPDAFELSITLETWPRRVTLNLTQADSRERKMRGGLCVPHDDSHTSFSGFTVKTSPWHQRPEGGFFVGKCNCPSSSRRLFLAALLLGEMFHVEPGDFVLQHPLTFLTCIQCRQNPGIPRWQDGHRGHLADARAVHSSKWHEDGRILSSAASRHQLNMKRNESTTALDNLRKMLMTNLH